MGETCSFADRTVLVTIDMIDTFLGYVFTMKRCDILETDRYIRLTINKPTNSETELTKHKYIHIPWNQIKQFVIEEVEEDDDENKQLHSGRIIQSGSADS